MLQLLNAAMAEQKQLRVIDEQMLQWNFTHVHREQAGFGPLSSLLTSVVDFVLLFLQYVRSPKLRVPLSVSRTAEPPFWPSVLTVNERLWLLYLRRSLYATWTPDHQLYCLHSSQTEKTPLTWFLAVICVPAIRWAVCGGSFLPCSLSYLHEL